jgi:hypothetical protein
VYEGECHYDAPIVASAGGTAVIKMRMSRDIASLVTLRTKGSRHQLGGVNVADLCGLSKDDTCKGLPIYNYTQTLTQTSLEGCQTN